jgi:hypothetical protein
MTYTQWVEQCRKQAAERQAEAEASADEDEADETDLASDSAAVPAEMARIAPAEALAAAVEARKEADESTVPAKSADPTWLPVVEFFKAGEPFSIGDISISPFTVPHDAADPVGFVFHAEE